MDKEINFTKVVLLIMAIILLLGYITWLLKQPESPLPPFARKGHAVAPVVLLYCLYLLYQEIRKLFQRGKKQRIDSDEKDDGEKTGRL